MHLAASSISYDFFIFLFLECHSFVIFEIPFLLYSGVLSKDQSFRLLCTNSYFLYQTIAIGFYIWYFS